MLISVYEKEKPEFLDKCLESVFSQTLFPSEVVLVCDGKLTGELYRVIDGYKEKFKDTFKPVYVEKNVGTASAANIGIKTCKNELILKCDSDDICRPYRCEKQVNMFEKDSELMMAGGYIEEFDSDTGEKIAVKKVPLTHEEIIKYAKRRNPINNPSIAVRKSAVIDIGGFNEDQRCEDYDFVCRMLMAGKKSANTNEILVDYRVTAENYGRRRNWKNTRSFIEVRWRNFRRGFSGFTDFLIPCAAQLFLFVMPIKITERFYKKHLR